MLYIAYAVLWLLRFALGACVFSFLGVVVWRLPRRESVVKGRSHCPVCGRTLSAAELLPCLSYLLQGGKCRGCGAKIPARDFWIEVLGGLCSCACAYAFGGETAQAALAFAVLGIL
ncbi:MAG: prepilin peptidase, partial [Butyricicoccus sp.]